MEQEYQYDLFVIGGGSGGLAASKEAAQYGLKVAVADFVKPSPAGTSWGLGGTCVNVGCIPKKLMHYASLLGEIRVDQQEAGWAVDTSTPHQWSKMVEKIKGHIVGLNWTYTFQLSGKGIKYYNSLAKFVDAHTIELTDAKGVVEKVTAKNILIAVGGRPNYPDNIPNIKELSITSDDLFYLKNSPGKTLVVGASYVALECGGFLNGLGLSTTIMVRSILLRGYDQDIAKKIGNHMESKGVKFIHGAIPVKMEKLENGKVKVTYKQQVEGQNEEKISEEDFDTILIAIGRSPDTKGLNLEAAGVKIEKNGKIQVGADDKTSQENIYAIGDCAYGRPEFTPTAIMAGRLLARRLAL